MRDGRIFLGIGSNLPGTYTSSTALVHAAIARLNEGPLRIVHVSPLYRSAPVGPADQGDYVNGVLAVSSNLTPVALLSYLHLVEIAFGRLRRIKWGPRTLDLDLLDYRGQMHDHLLQVPHPRLAHRSFVLCPLMDIAPGWRHPRTGQTIAGLLAAQPAHLRRSLYRLGGGESV